MYTILPLYPETTFEYTTSLAGKTYIFQFEWNTRTSSLYFSIYDEGNTPIAIGLKLVPGTYMVDFGSETSKLSCLPATKAALNAGISLNEVPTAYRLVFFEV